MAKRYSVDTKKSGKVLELLQVEQVKESIARLMKEVDQADLGQIAIRGARMLESSARAKGWPRRAIDSIFAYSKLDPNESRRKGPSALFGFRKRGRSQPYAPGYVEWNPGRSKSKRAKSLVIPGVKAKDGALQKVGMSLATMFEFGTSKMRARPALRETIATMRAIYPAAVGAILQNIFAKHNRTQSGAR